MTGSRREPRPGRRVRMGVGRETDLTRRAGRRDQRRSLLVATNGRSTEVEYLKAVKGEPWVRARVAVVFEAGSPVDLVRGAARRRDRDDYDGVLAVCDVDDYDTDTPSSMAVRLDVSLLWSNPCFEVWLILHRADCTAHITDAREAGRRLERLLGSWDKTKLDFSRFRDGVEVAVSRAKALGDPPHVNPSTAVWRLVEALRGKPVR